MTDLSLNTVRKTLISIAIDMCDPSQEPALVQARLADVKRLLNDNRWSLSDIVFYGFVAYLGDSEVKREPEIADILREEMEGKRGYWNTEVFKENLLSAMRPVYIEAYQTLKRLVALIEAAERITPEYQDEVDTMREQIFTLKEEYQPETVGELMVSLAAQVLSRLPWNYPLTFKNYDDDESVRTSMFSGLYEGPIQRSEHLDYVQKLLQQVDGQRPFYIDVTILPEYCLVNVR